VAGPGVGHSGGHAPSRREPVPGGFPFRTRRRSRASPPWLDRRKSVQPRRHKLHKYRRCGAPRTARALCQGLHLAPLHCRHHNFRPLLELVILQVQSFRGRINPMRAGQFSRRRPQRLWNRQAVGVRTPPPLETPVNLPHVWGNNRNLVGYRLPSSPRGAMDRR
jgi:hypothetical protein